MSGLAQPSWLDLERRNVRSEARAAGKQNGRSRKSLASCLSIGPLGPSNAAYEILPVFQTYRKLSSVAVATFFLAFRVARFSAERTFSLMSPNSAKGTLRAAPSLSSSRSRKIAETIVLCLPFRE